MTPPLKTEPAAWFDRSTALVLALLLLAALYLRVYLAATTVFIWDEEREWIPIALAISLDPSNLNLPLRTDYHGALGAYFIRISEMIFGQTHLGYRATSIIAGLGTIIFVTMAAGSTWGRPAALVAATIMTFNEFHIMMSSVAIQYSFFLCLQAIAIFGGLRFIKTERPVFLYVAATFSALAFLTYELAAFIAPVILVIILMPRFRKHFTSIHLYIAIAVGLLILTPDMIANLADAPEGESGYGTLLDRIGGIGFKPAYLAFLFREPLELAYSTFLGRTSISAESEFAAMNAVLGSVIALAALTLLVWMFTARGRARLDLPVLSMLGYFAFVYLFFLAIEPPSGTEVAHWIWIGSVLIPGVLVAACVVPHWALQRGVIVGAAILVASISTYRVHVERFDMDQYRVQIEPEFLIGEAGQRALATAHFDRCDWCPDNGAPSLSEITVSRSRGASSPVGYVPAKDMATGAGTADDPFLFQIGQDFEQPSWMARIYRLNYAFDTGRGSKAHVEALALVPHEKDKTRPAIFWVHDPDKLMTTD